MSDPRSILLAAIDALESGSFEYLIYGGLASGLWGEPRYTEDVDLVIFLPERHVYKFLRVAANRGFAVDEDLAIQQMQVSGWARLPLGKGNSPWHLDLTLGDSPFDKSALKRRKEVTIFDRKVWVASPEDVILYKLVAGRDRDLSDVQRIVERQEALDRTYLRKWAGWWEEQGIKKVLSRLDGLWSA